jgi:hypothetical protein
VIDAFSRMVVLPPISQPSPDREATRILAPFRLGGERCARVGYRLHVRLRRIGKLLTGRRKKRSSLAGVLDRILQPGRVARRRRIR